MKKAKFVVTAIAVVGIVGGALAFQAKRGNATLFTYDGAACNASIQNVFAGGSLEALSATVTVTTATTIDPTLCQNPTFYGQE